MKVNLHREPWFLSNIWRKEVILPSPSGMTYYQAPASGSSWGAHMHGQEATLCGIGPLLTSWLCPPSTLAPSPVNPYWDLLWLGGASCQQIPIANLKDAGVRCVCFRRIMGFVANSKPYSQLSADNVSQPEEDFR